LARLLRERERRRKIIDINDYLKKKPLNEEVDRILDKVIKSGIESLTKEEKNILIEAGHYFKNFDKKI
jgi:hypothetical protein